MSKCLGGIIDCKDKTSPWHLNGFLSLLYALFVFIFNAISLVRAAWEVGGCAAIFSLFVLSSLFSRPRNSQLCELRIDYLIEDG